MAQEFPMQSYAFAPPNLGVGDNKKNYVFVDEHNRHKRLKVMRACEGCRRRKIKCDAATTNSWPCAACVRLKLSCVPPSLNYDRVHGGAGSHSGLEGVLDFDHSSASGEDDHYFQHGEPTQFYDFGHPNDSVHNPQVGYGHHLGSFNAPANVERPPSHSDFSYDPVTSMPMTLPETFHQPASFQAINVAPPPPHPSHGSTWTSDQYSPTDLSDVLGQLSIKENGVALYISQQKKSLAEAPALEEVEVKLPSTAMGSGSTVRIPPDLMPPEEQCLAWFELFFAHVHPYVPVLSKSYFYQQWQTNRQSISPLILEAIFACVGRMSDDPTQGAQWLALASKHEDCFMDVPRLSTIQALLLLLKAREAAPKRGYYYRSWMTVKTLVAMAKDLELHEHYADHQAGQDCEHDPTECLIRTRIWQNIFVCEMMIGGPQGRFDMGVDPDTVDFNFGVHGPVPGVDTSDYQISRQFQYLVRNVRNVRHLNDTYGKVRRQKDWASDPKFTSLNPEAISWADDLPKDLQVEYPEGDAPPYLSNHFVGNMHCYYHLNVIMVHRPQLMSSRSFAAGGSWKKHMEVCYESSKKICRLQEAIYQTFGLSGLLCMQRGINFVIYTVLTCTMIHLVAITSPEPEFNKDAKKYFTRHMLLLENCTSAWPMPEMQSQIDALREAFSADINKPFRLRHNFPHGSPRAPLKHSQSEPAETKYPPTLGRQTSHEQSARIRYGTQPLTPPISAGLEDTNSGSMNLGMLPNSHHQGPHIDNLGFDHSEWNPSKIFENWDTAFPTPASTMQNGSMIHSQPSPPIYTPNSIGSYDMPHVNESLQQQQQQYPMQSTMAPLQQCQPALQMPQYATTTPTPSFVTSSMWRDTVASTFDPGGMKRRWDAEDSFLSGVIDTVSPKRIR
ncbi:MAG: hypothetical protein LQ339_008984 [Xanthoria mediterranea]|nr:MAG: hypothetical protein LQ339_008984 [Xanthoria mediterranea]